METVGVDVPYLLSLPIELRESIMLELDVKNVISYCRTSKELNLSCEKDSFWQRKFFRDFPYMPLDYVPEETWRQTYKDFSTKLLKRVRIGVGTDYDHTEFWEATALALNELLDLNEEEEKSAFFGFDDNPDLFQYLVIASDGDKIYDLLEPNLEREQLKDFYFMIEDLPVGSVREEWIEWEGTNVFDRDIAPEPTLFRFVKTAPGEGFMIWKVKHIHEVTWIIEFHNPGHDFGELPPEMI